MLLFRASVARGTELKEAPIAIAGNMCILYSQVTRPTFMKNYDF
jgi:hypothetical protein